MNTDSLTREQVLAMKPGRELDALVAEKVMRWKIRRTTVLAYGSNPLATFRTLYTVTDGRGIDWSPTYDLDGVGLPRYSTDTSAAFEVVEKMPMPFKILKSYQETFGVGPIGWIVNWCDNYADCGCHLDGDNCHAGKSVWAETAPLAICRAALLLAVMGDE